VIGIILRLLDRILLSLPLVLVALLALGSYWMLRTAPALDKGPLPRPPDHTPDYVLEKFSAQKFDTHGRLTLFMRGESAQRLPDRDWVEVQKFSMHATDVDGLVKHASADLGISSSDSKEFELRGKVRLLQEAKAEVNSPRLEISGEFLHFLADLDRIESNKPVQLLHGKQQFNADSMVYNGKERSLQLDGRVRATLLSESNLP
jgi:lipopolysaccharide export system protein LptC